MLKDNEMDLLLLVAPQHDSTFTISDAIDTANAYKIQGALDIFSRWSAEKAVKRAGKDVWKRSLPKNKAPEFGDIVRHPLFGACEVMRWAPWQYTDGVVTVSSILHPKSHAYVIWDMCRILLKASDPLLRINQ